MNDVRPSSTRSRTWRFWTMNDARVILVAVGTMIACIGGLVAVNDIPPRQYVAIAAWLAAALIAHDVIIAGVVFAVAFAGRRVAGRVPVAWVVIAQCALAVGAIVTVIVVPEIVKDAAGTTNPSILPFDYAANLAIFLAVLAVATAAAIGLHVALARRIRPRRPTR